MNRTIGNNQVLLLNIPNCFQILEIFDSVPNFRYQDCVT